MKEEEERGRKVLRDREQDIGLTYKGEVHSQLTSHILYVLLSGCWTSPPGTFQYLSL